MRGVNKYADRKWIKDHLLKHYLQNQINHYFTESSLFYSAARGRLYLVFVQFHNSTRKEAHLSLFGTMLLVISQITRHYKRY